MYVYIYIYKYIHIVYTPGVVPGGGIAGSGAAFKFLRFWGLRTPLQNQRRKKAVGAPPACPHKHFQQDHQQ
jgi:hypothetical protein